MSDTPRTDAKEIACNFAWSAPLADFARTLERELGDAREEERVNGQLCDAAQTRNADLLVELAERTAYAEALRALVDRAVGVLQRHAPPGGLSDHEAMSAFYSVFDGPEYRTAVGEAFGK